MASTVISTLSETSICLKTWLPSSSNFSLTTGPKASLIRPLKISLPVVILDETMKFIARNWVDGTWKWPLTAADRNSWARCQMLLQWLGWILIWAGYGLFLAYPYLPPEFGHSALSRFGLLRTDFSAEL